MSRYIVKRFISIIITLIILATITFSMMHAVPGGPFTTDRKLPAEVEAAIMEKYHLNDSVITQYFDYMKGLARFDLGPSFKYDGMSVNDLIKLGFPTSAKVGIIAVLLVVFIGIPLGIVSGLNPNRHKDKIIMFISTLGIVIPSFVLATILLYIFSVRLKILPFYGIDSWKGFVLPAISLGGFSIAYITRLTRSSILEVMNQDYMITADAKGLKRKDIIFKHALKNALIPIVTVLGPTVASLLTGTFVIEKIFALPGMGKHFVNAISNRDYTVIMGITLFYALFLTIMVFIVDIIYAIVDPRIKISE